MEILLLLIVGFVVWHFIPQRDPNQPAPNFRAEPRAVASDPLWPTYVEEHCESPAETAFLRAMIKAFDLKPEGNSLSGGGIRLDFQVEEGCYRTDFLANRWLVIEIDGAAYHSSEEAIARDAERDKYFESLGYSVIRIPAKVVFNTPNDAVQRVRAALQVGKLSHPAPVQKNGWRRLSETMTAIGDGISAVNASLAQKWAVDEALKEARSAFDAEKVAIEAAIGRAKSSLWLDDFLDEDPSNEAEYAEVFTSLEQKVKERRRPRLDNDRSTLVEVTLFPFAPLKDKSSKFDAEIEAGFLEIVEARSAFINSTRAIVMDDAQLCPRVEEALREMERVECWELLTGDRNRPF